MALADEDALPPGRSLGQTIGFWLGPAIALLTLVTPAPAEMPVAAWRISGLGLWMAIWWATEAAPIAATSLLPLVMIPLLGGGNERQAAAPYANPIVLLLLGGSILAVAIERWGLHRRIALNILAPVGDRPRLLVLGFMAATALISMWISNTATALMMLPIALSVAATTGNHRLFSQAMVLGVAYASSIGGVATPIGTPTNLIAMGWLSENQRAVSFADWMAIGVPAMLVMLPLAWMILVWRLPSGLRIAGAAVELAAERQALGGLTTPETRCLAVIGLVIIGWVFGDLIQEFPPLKDMTDLVVVMVGAVALMVIPAGGGEKRGRNLLSWEEAVKAPWAVILLFGGGISLAEAMERTGLALWLGDQLGGLAGVHPLLLVLVITGLVIVMTEFMSNVATITMMLPILAVLAKAAGIDPVTLVVPAAIAASCGFMMPAGTGSNAAAYATGRTSVAGMMGHGFFVNLVALMVMTAVGFWLAPQILG